MSVDAGSVGEHMLGEGEGKDFVEYGAEVASGFGGGFDDFALEVDGEFFKFGLKIVGFADHHRVDEFFDTFRIR